MPRESRARRACVLATLALLAVVRPADGDPTPPAVAPIERSGSGHAITEPFDLVEGAAEFTIRHTTGSANTYFSVGIAADPTGTGVWSGGAQNPAAVSICQAGYADAQALERRVSVPVHWNGPTRLEVSAAGTWSIRIEQSPAVKHAVEGVVFDPAKLFAEGAEVVLADDRGDSATVVTNRLGEFHLPAWGGRSYTLRATARSGQTVSALVAVPAYLPMVAKKSLELAPPGAPERATTSERASPRRFGVPATPETGIHGTVRFAGGQPIAGEQVLLLARGPAGSAIRGRQTTGEDGHYRFSPLAPGTYSVLAGGALSAYTDESTARSVPDLKADESRRVDFDLVAAAVLVRGRVLAPDKDNRTLPVRRARLEIDFTTPGGGHAPVESWTDDDGCFRVHCATHAASCAVTVSLFDRDGILAVRSKALGGEIVELRTRDFPFAGPLRSLEIVFGRSDVCPDGTKVPELETMRDGGAWFARSWRPMRLATDRLKLRLDHKLPVDVTLHITETKDKANLRVSYQAEDSRIDVGLAKSPAHSGDSPDNREYHEFGHHVHADAAMSGENRLPDRLPGDSNHGGIRNGDSRDSLAEGFATFFAVLCSGSPKYRIGGQVFNLQRHHHYLEPGVPCEELQVAALLWDLIDDDEKGLDPEARDQVCLPLDRLWAALNQPSVVDVRSLYEALRKSLGEGDGGEERLARLDRLFVLDRFFHDANRNGRHDPGEEIGWADFYEKPKGGRNRSSIPRRAIPVPPHCRLGCTVEDEQGRAIEAPYYAVRRAWEDGSVDEDLAQPSEGGVFVPPAADLARFTLWPLAAGFRTEPFELDGADLLAAIALAAQAGREEFHRHRFLMRPNGVAPPEGVEASIAAGGEVSLSWRASATVAVVRGSDHPPGSLEDGEEIYRGTDGACVDLDVFDGRAFTYAAFTVTDTGETSVPAPAAWVGLAPEPGSPVRRTGGPEAWHWPMLAAIALGIAAIVLVRRRRRRGR